MGARKSVIVTSSVKDHRWAITVTGSDAEGRRVLVEAITSLERKGFLILNGTSPFETEKKRVKKPKTAAVEIERKLPLAG